MTLTSHCAFDRSQLVVVDNVLEFELQKTVPENATLPAKLLLAMSTILQQPEADVAHLELRSFASSLAEDALELLNTEEALCGMTAAEQKDTQQLLDSVQRDREKSAAFCDTLRELLAKKKKQGRKRKAVNFPGRPELKLEPVDLQQYLPVDRSRLCRDSLTAGGSASIPPRGTVRPREEMNTCV